MLFVAVGKKRKTHQLTHQVASSVSRSLVTFWLAREKRGKFTREKNNTCPGQAAATEARSEKREEITKMVARDPQIE